MATITDIASHANVSISTVSHVLNKTRHVSDETTQRVLEAIERFNYSPSALARGLKMSQTKTLGMLITSSANPFFAEVLKGVDRACYDQGYNLILCHTESDPIRMNRNIALLLQKRVDGLLIICSSINASTVELLNKNKHIPMVMMDWSNTSCPGDKLQDNSEHGGFLATEYLIAQGHRQIGCITGPMDRLTAKLRYNGFVQAMAYYQLPINNDWIIAGDFEYQGGVNAFEQLLDNCCFKKVNAKSLPTALFVSNDAMAIGVYKSAKSHHIVIPDQLSVMGYDNIELADFITPALTTMQQPKQALGEQAIHLLISRIDEPERPVRIVQLNPDLVIRDSVCLCSAF